MTRSQILSGPPAGPAEDLPDLKDGSWSKAHLMQFLARRPTVVRIIPPTWDEMQRPDQVHVQHIGYQGHFFHVRKGTPELVPDVIGAIIDNMLDPFPTQQSKLRRMEITDLRQLPTGPGGIQGFELPDPR